MRIRISDAISGYARHAQGSFLRFGGNQLSVEIRLSV